MSTPFIDSAKKKSLDRHRQMSLYSLAATAAGVGMSALAMPAKAEVIVTKLNPPIPISFQVSLDLNHDGIPDFDFARSSYIDFSNFSNNVRVSALGGGAVVGYSGLFFPYAAALIRGAKIGPLAQFRTSTFGVMIERSEGRLSGPTVSQRLYGKWGHDPLNRYLGVRFLIHGAPHYGWVRLTISTHDVASMSGSVSGYAYETIPNKPIFAGSAKNVSEASNAKEKVRGASGPSLGMLALGAHGMPQWRRKEMLPD